MIHLSFIFYSFCNVIDIFLMNLSFIIHLFFNGLSVIFFNSFIMYCSGQVEGWGYAWPWPSERDSRLIPEQSANAIRCLYLYMFISSFDHLFIFFHFPGFGVYLALAEREGFEVDPGGVRKGDERRLVFGVWCQGVTSSSSLTSNLGREFRAMISG